MTTLQNFYKNQVVFITGGTGFLGKVLLNKLLLATEVHLVYLLIREKQNKTPQQRLEEMLDNDLFEGLKYKTDSKNQHVLSKVKAVSGDSSLPGLGLSADSRNLLLNNVTIIFHSAATVRFMEPLRSALKINVLSTLELVQLAKQMPNLRSFVHVSTAFVHCTKPQGDEYIPAEMQGGLSGVNACKLIDLMDDKMLDNLTPNLLDSYPNTYTFTKSLAENVIVSEAQDLPISVFRPVCVVSTYSEPMPGWVDNLYGPLGILQSILMGYLHVFRYRRHQIAQIVPVDFCVNALIATGYVTPQKFKNSDNSPKVFNYAIDTANPTTWDEYIATCIKIAREYPVRNLLWYPFLFEVESIFMRQLLRTLFHIIPSYFVDLWRGFTGNKTSISYRSSYQRLHRVNDLLDYFTMRDFHVNNAHVQHLWNDLSDEDKQLFPFDMQQVNWKQQHYASIMGFRHYMVKEGPDPKEVGRRRYAKLHRLHLLVSSSLLCLLSFLLCYYFF